MHNENRVWGHRTIIALALTLGLSSAQAHAQGADPPVINRAVSLSDAITLAEANNPVVLGARADSDAATGQAASSDAATKPILSTTTYGTVGSTPNNFTSSPGVMPLNILTVPSRGFIDQNLTLMVPLSNGSLLKARANLAHDQAAAAGHTADATTIAVARDAALAYDHALLQASLVDTARTRADQEDEQVRVTQQKVSTGSLAPLDLLREQAEQADAAQALVTTQNNAALAMIDLKIALGISLASNVTLGDDLNALYRHTPVLPTTLDDATRVAMQQRPEITAADQIVDAARAQAKAAQATYAPQIYGVGMADVSGMASGSGNAGYSVGLTASLPLIDGGQRRADVETADAHVRRTQADLLMAQQSVRRDVAEAWLALQSAEQERTAALSGVAAAQQGYDLAALRYNAGKSIAVEWLDALTALTRAKGNLAQATADVLDARARLEWAVG